jgi:hypothetical protein
MISELAALAALYKPHMTCVLHEGSRTGKFFSDTTATPDERLLIQRNYSKDFSEVIAIGYDEKRHQYVRAQVADDGSVATGTGNAPVNDVWTWKSVRVGMAGEVRIIHFGIVKGKLRYRYENGAFSVCT